MLSTGTGRLLKSPPAANTLDVFTCEKRYWTVIVVEPVAVGLPLSGEVKVAVTVAVADWPAVTASPVPFTTSTLMSEEDQVTSGVAS